VRIESYKLTAEGKREADGDAETTVGRRMRFGACAAPPGPDRGT
jgi:hypothetical protein